MDWIQLGLIHVENSGHSKQKNHCSQPSMEREHQMMMMIVFSLVDRRSKVSVICLHMETLVTAVKLVGLAIMVDREVDVSVLQKKKVRKVGTNDNARK